MLTAKEFSQAAQISYPIVMRMLKAGEIPGAEQTGFRVWQIPARQAEAFAKKRPKRGRPPLTEEEKAKRAAAKKKRSAAQ